MRVISVGDNCIDYYVEDQIGYPGGNPVNVAVYMKRYGIECSYMGVVGDDDFGKIIMESIANKGVDISYLKVTHGSSAISEVKLVEGNRIFTDYNEGVLKDFRLSLQDIEIINSYDLMVSGIWSKVENDLDKINIPIAYDFSDQWDSDLWSIVLPHVQYVFYSDDVHDINDIKRNMENIYQKHHQVIVCTRGKYGSIAYDGCCFYNKESIDCNVVDTMGAGDSFIAGFLVSYFQKRDLIKALEAGARNSSITIQYMGAW